MENLDWITDRRGNLEISKTKLEESQVQNSLTQVNTNNEYNISVAQQVINNEPVWPSPLTPRRLNTAARNNVNVNWKTRSHLFRFDGLSKPLIMFISSEITMS